LKEEKMDKSLDIDKALKQSRITEREVNVKDFVKSFYSQLWYDDTEESMARNGVMAALEQTLTPEQLGDEKMLNCVTAALRLDGEVFSDLGDLAKTYYYSQPYRVEDAH
jgi:hypothetical protein